MKRTSMSEDALANASGVSPRTVGNFLRPGNRASRRGTSHSFPSGTLANLIKIATALEVEPWELLCPEHRHRLFEAVESAYQERVRAERRNGK